MNLLSILLQAPAGGSQWSGILMMVVIVAIFYFFNPYRSPELLAAGQTVLSC